MAVTPDLQIKRSRVLFSTAWGTADHALNYLRETRKSPGFFPSFFHITDRGFCINDQVGDSPVIKYFDRGNKLVFIDSFRSLMGKGKTPMAHRPLDCCSRGSLLYFISATPTVEQPQRCMLIEDDGFEACVLNENLIYNEKDASNIFHIDEKGTAVVCSEGHFSVYTREGNRMQSLEINRNIMHIDRDSNVYVKSSPTVVDVYRLSSGLDQQVASVEVPAEAGNDFWIHGGNTASYLYQWKVDYSSEERFEVDRESQGRRFRTCIELYTLDRSTPAKWELRYRGRLVLGTCEMIIDRRNSEVKRVVNYIDTKKQFLHIDDDGAIYHDEWDDAGFRIVYKVLD